MDHSYLILKKMLKNMKLGKYKSLIFAVFLFFTNNFSALSADKIESVPLINLEELSPTFEEDKDELEKLEKIDDNQSNNENEDDNFNEKESDKIYINLKALDKITAKTSTFRLAVGEKKFFGPLEIKALKCQLSISSNTVDTVAYLQVKDLSNKNNNQVFLFNGWTFASSPTLQSIDHPIYDLWITSCDNI